MPKVRFKEMVVEIQGTMYHVVFKKSPRERRWSRRSRIHLHWSAGTSVSKVKWSKAQKDNRKRMRYANNYAKAVMADPKVRAVYEKKAAKEGRVAYNVAFSDYWKGKNLLPK